MSGTPQWPDDRMPTYAQKEKELELLAGIHAAVIGDVEATDFETIKKIIVNGGGRAAFPVGTVLVTEKGDYTYPWMFVHHGQHADGRYYAHLRVMKAIDLMQFDAAEAFYYNDTGSALTAGNYNVQVPTAYGAAAVGYYNFTLTADLPAGGRLVGFYNCYSSDPSGTNITAYDAANDKTASQSVVMTRSETATGTTLGKLQAGGDDDVTGMNSIQRAAYGSNNWAQSAIRKYLNSSATTGSVWASSNKFDVAPSWHSTATGFLTKLPQGFIDIVNAVSMKTITNSVFETDYTKSSNYTTKDKFWLPSRYQVFGSTEGSDLSEEQWDYYKGASDTDRIMFDASGAARGQWLRSPVPGVAYHVRNVNTSGAVHYNGAVSALAASPACEISESLLDS